SASCASCSAERTSVQSGPMPRPIALRGSARQAVSTLIAAGGTLRDNGASHTRGQMVMPPDETTANREPYAVIAVLRQQLAEFQSSAVWRCQIFSAIAIAAGDVLLTLRPRRRLRLANQSCAMPASHSLSGARKWSLPR